MKRYLLSLGVVAAMLFVTSAAYANTVQIRWTDCEGDGGVDNITFACASNVGNRAFQTAVTLTTDLLDVLSTEITIDLVGQNAPVLPPWWSLRDNATLGYLGCRPIGSTQAITIAAFDGASCPDMFALAGSMNIAGFIPDKVIVGSGRILSVNAVPSTSPVALVLADNPAGNGTWNTGRFNLNSQKTVGTPSCAGCTEPVCIVLNSVNITTVGNLNNRLCSGGAPLDRVTWQGAGADCQSVPVKNVSWGRVKSLYR